MKLDLFNPWRDLVKWSGLTLQYQTSKRGDTWTTYIREKDSKQPITFGISRTSKEESQQRAKEALNAIGVEGVQKAMETGQMVRPSAAIPQPSERKEIQWRDGIGHSHRAQRDIVDGKPQR